MKWGEKFCRKTWQTTPPKKFSDTDVFEALREMFFYSL
jgi:hypothetical protein